MQEHFIVLLIYVLSTTGFIINSAPTINSAPKIHLSYTKLNAIEDITHLLDYLPYRQEGLAACEDFRTSPLPPSTLRNRKMNLGTLEGRIGIEDVLEKPLWPSTWPYGPEGKLYCINICVGICMCCIIIVIIMLIFIITNTFTLTPTLKISVQWI